MYTICWKTGKLANRYCLEGVFWDFCQFSLLDDTFRCLNRSTGSYCANNSFQLFCKNKSPDLTLWKVACFALEWYWFALECYAFLLFFTHANLASPNRFQFNLNWKRVGKQRVVYSLWQLLTLWWVFNKNFQFEFKLNFFTSQLCRFMKIMLRRKGTKRVTFWEKTSPLSWTCLSSSFGQFQIYLAS